MCDMTLCTSIFCICICIFYTAKGIVCAVPPRQRVVEYTFPTKCTAETIPFMHILLKVSLKKQIQIQIQNILVTQVKPATSC
jgi:hypothetical protein